MKKISEYWRRFEELGIVFASKLRNNLFLKTQITFIFVLFAVSIANIASLAILANYISTETQETIFGTWGSGFFENVPSPSFTILELQEQLDRLKLSYVLAIGLANVAVLIILIFIVSKVALEPTRDAINAQRNFIGYTAHELRTPLSIARTNIEATLLTKDMVSKEECLEELQRTMMELDSLAGIINNLVTLNTLSNFKPAEYHHYDLHDLIGEVVKSFTELADSKQITIKVNTNPGLFVWANRNAVKQMIGNVLVNAINYSHEGGEVVVRGQQLSHRYVRVLVSDHGVGIAKDDLPFIFKPFYRSALILNRKEGGSGLGLSIVRELVRLHLGRVSVQSTQGEGTTVQIDLPIFRHRGLGIGDRTKHQSPNEVTYDFARGKE